MRIARSVVEALRAAGHDASHLLEEGLETLEDGAILAKARAEERVVLTHDLDFGHLLAAGGHSTPSVVTFRLSNMRGENVLLHLWPTLQAFAAEIEGGAAVSVGDGSARCRVLPFNPPRGSA